MRRPKRYKKVISLALAAALTLMLCVPALAAEGAHTYRVRIYSGQRGLIDGGQVRELTVAPGERVNFYPGDVSLLDDGKYYVKGIRESGKDNREANASFTVDRDMDYVVAYGILGNSVAYTVNYLDGEGNELLPGETFYGNVGDRPVIAYKYIEGWLPQAYNLTKTLSENAAENVFDFVYTRTDQNAGAAGSENGGDDDAGNGGTDEGDQYFNGSDGTDSETSETVSTETTDENTENVDNGAGNAGGNGSTDTETTGVTERVEGTDGADAGNGQDAGAVVPDEQTPRDLQSLDDEETPLANIGEGIKNLVDPDGDGLLVNIPKPLIGACLAVLVFLFILFILHRDRQKRKEYTGNGKE